MLTKISQGVDYISEKIEQIIKEQIDKDVLETILEEKFQEKIAPLVTEEDMKMIRDNAEDQDFAESYMIQKVPNYSTLLEETVTEVLAEYLTQGQSEETK